MKKALIGAAGAMTLMVGVTLGGFSSAAAQPVDLTILPVDPNVVTDSTAWVAGVPVLNPQGQQGVETVFTHRDGTRTVTDSIAVFNDAAAATSAMTEARGALGSQIANSTTQPAPVGTGGMIATGTNPDNTRSVAILTFTEGNTFTTIEFEGPTNDAAPVDLIIDYGQKQAAAIISAGL